MFVEDDLKTCQIIKPDDYVYEEGICTKIPVIPKIFTEPTSTEKLLMEKNKIFALKKQFPFKKFTKKENESMWDFDLSKLGRSHFDASGNFIIGDGPKPLVCWLVKRGNEVLGPFTVNEMSQMVNSGELENTLIRRDTDQGFIEFDRINAEVENFLFYEFLDDYMERNEVVEVKKLAQRAFFEDLSDTAFRKNRTGDDSFDLQKAMDRCQKAKKMIYEKNPVILFDKLLMSLEGKTKSKAIDLVSQLVGTDKIESNIIVDLIIGECHMKVFSDVDADGFASAKMFDTHKSKRK